MRVWEQTRTEQELTVARLGMWEYLQHLSAEDMDAVLADIPLAPGAIEGIAALRTAGIGTIIASLALASHVAYFAGRLGVDAHFGTALPDDFTPTWHLPAAPVDEIVRMILESDRKNASSSIR